MENSGHDPTARVVSFSDGVFGFALTLLVFPFETPTRFAQVLDFVRLGLAYALGAVLIAMIWWQHNRFFRLFRGMDRALVALNTELLFVMLVFVYPLKFLAVYLGNLFLGESNGQLISRAEVPTLMMLYGSCFAGICLLLFLMHRGTPGGTSGRNLAPPSELKPKPPPERWLSSSRWRWHRSPSFG